VRGLDDLRLQDALLIRQQQEIEGQFVTATTRHLRAEVLARFGPRAGARSIRRGALTDWGESYAQGMLVSLLYGALHAQRILDSQVQQPTAPQRIELAEQWSTPFAEAEQALLGMVAINKEEYRGLEAGAKFRAFTIARVGSEDIIRRIQALYQRQLAQGADRAELLRDLRPLLEAAGIGDANPWWLQTHYRNNMMAAYNAGRDLQLRDNPLVAALMYDAIVDDATTKLCTELDGTILPKGDPRVRSISPPNHHQCRSVWTPLTRELISARGLRVADDFSIGRLREDPQIAREHQFRASPSSTLELVPAALAERASRYQKWPEILRFTARAIRGQIQRRLQAVRAADYVPRDVREHLADGEIWLGTVRQPDGSVRAMIHVVRVQGRAITVVRIGLQRGTGSAYMLLAPEWAKLRRTWQRIE
jgi:SPP1 gp7 family putative phage head morphogenesis protein